MRIRRHWNERGIASLKDAPPSGRPPKVRAAYRKQLQEVLHQGPLAYGYVCTTRSFARLNARLHRVTGIRICTDRL
jgi:transposase